MTSGSGSAEGPGRIRGWAGRVAGALGSSASGPDPLLLALARYVQALDERYPKGPSRCAARRLRPERTCRP